MDGRPTAIDLFAGAGGMSVGFEQAGFDVVAAVEYDPVHAAVHAYNFPQTETMCRDISTVTASELLNAVERRVGKRDLDVVFGGPPCQGFSTIGKRLYTDARNRLVLQFHRLVVELRPRYFVMENVPGMMAGGHSGILAELIDAFEASGYRVARPVRLLNAADYGVPQDRRRLILLGSRADQPDVDYPSPTVRPVGKRGSTLERRGDPPNGPTVNEALRDLPDLDDFEELLTSDEVHVGRVRLNAMGKALSDYARRLREPSSDPADLSHPRVWDRAKLTSSARTAHTPVSIERFTATPPGTTEAISRFYRLHRDGLCNTLRAGTGSERGAFTSPRPIHPTLPRVISVREAARLHSFPDWFRFHTSKWHGFRQIGNAVCPLLGRHVAAEIVRALEMSPTRPVGVLELGDPQLLKMNMSEAARLFQADAASIPAPRRRAAAMAG